MSQESLAKKRGIADIVILLDVSGSMRPCLDALRRNIEVLIDTMVNPGPNADAVIKDWRIKVAGFSDFKADGDLWWQEHPFSSDPVQVKADLNSLELRGGGDEPESLLDALWKIAMLPSTEKGASPQPEGWRYRSDAARVVVAFTDASCHLTTSIPEAAGAGFEDVQREIHAARLRISLFCPEADCYTSTLSQIDKIEIETVGTLSDAVQQMDAFTSNPENFKNTLRALAKSISQSGAADTPAL